jgi:hypothetical protein
LSASSATRRSSRGSCKIDVLIRSREVASQFVERFCVPAEESSSPGRRLTGAKERARATAFALLSPLL